MHFALPELCGAALSRLKAACRFDPSKEMHARMRDDALDAHREWAERAELRAVAVRFASSAPRGRALELAGVRFACAAFGLIDARNVIETVVYALTLAAGEAPSRGVSRLFYEDLWANAYLEAALCALKSDLAARAGGVPSDSFGPGYYGMALEEMPKLARVSDFGRIGGTVLENGMLQPPKSCAGIFFVVRDAARMPERSCRGCAGDPAGCAFCAHRAARPHAQMMQNRKSEKTIHGGCSWEF
ncbi:MAG: hypothetical protein LBP73_03280 [Clostridiales Family XIII bacterium]|jgi:hypothetical protein|nr:hypothetical protein [Clostridiales Family XIII bacterium]